VAATPIITLPQSHVWVHTGNGYGSTGTKIRRWSTVKHNVGTAITYSDSASNGGSFQISEAGYYSIVRTDYLGAGSVNIGLSVNSNQLSTQLGSITSSHYLNNAASGAANLSGIVAWTDYFEVGDVIRAHDSGTVADGNNFLVSMNIIKIGV